MAAVAQVEFGAVLVERIDELLVGLRATPAARSLLLDKLRESDHRAAWVATTEHPEALDRTELGAFKDIVPILYPDKVERLDVLRIHTRGLEIDPAVHMVTIAETTGWWSGRELKELVEFASEAGTLSQSRVSMAQTTIDKSVNASQRKARTAELVRFTIKRCSSKTLRRAVEQRYGMLVSLAKKRRRRAETSLTETRIMVQELIMGDQIKGDQYKVGQAGAVGPKAHAHNIDFKQVWNDASGTVDLSTLARQLATVRNELLLHATEAEQYEVIGALASAEVTAKKGDGPATFQSLAKAGRWALEVATKIGENVAAAAIRSSLGLP